MDNPDVRVVSLSEELESQVLRISIHERQEQFHPSIRSSIDLARQYEDAQLLAILAEEYVCGFALYGVDLETGKWKIFRLLIDKEFQGKGIGKRAMSQILQKLRQEENADEVLLVVNAENFVAVHIYQALGFVQYGVRDDKLLMKAFLR